MSGYLQNLLLTLFLQVGLMIGFAAMVAAFRPLREALVGDRDEPWWRMARVVLEIGILLTALRARFAMGYEAWDVSLEGAFIIGWVHGPTAGAFGGLILGGLAAYAGWPASLPALTLVGLIGSLLPRQYRDAADWVKGKYSTMDAPVRQLVYCVATLFSCKALWLLLSWAKVAPGITVLRGPLSIGPILIASVLSVAAPLWIWRGLIVETELMRRTRQVERARMETLMERFRPHFLFNTLGAIVSLMRIDVEGARNMTLKLAGLLRRSLDEDVYSFVPLSEELRFADDYLGIEKTRHGDRLKTEKDIPPDLMDYPVPRMILQPLIENAILHGIDPKVEGGTVTVRARRDGMGLVIEVSDDGVGVAEKKEAAKETKDRVKRRDGIGLNNLRARLKLAYREEAKLELKPGPGGVGTTAALLLPGRRA